MSTYEVLSVRSTPVHAPNRWFKRLLFVRSIEVKRWDNRGYEDVSLAFENDVEVFDLYVDFRPGLRSQWRPWIYAYSSITKHRLAPFDREKGPGAYEFVIQQGRLDVANRWWELLNRRFPNVAMEPEKP